ncbi:DUF6207 family protein [Streptomyces sp. NPDC002994]|uniref:DUF6207 family protein n=1 Tax=Streptomyces sp. NPDC002994 TaxID=3154441 RepID=UPI0033AF997B
MRIDEQHIAEPGLVVLDVTAADEDTMTSSSSGPPPASPRLWRTPGEAGARARVYADIRHPGTTG